MYAARDNPRVLSALISGGADIKLVNQTGQTAFDIALEHHPEASTMLIAAGSGQE